MDTLTSLGTVSIVRPSNRQEPSKIQNRAGRVITGSSYVARSADALNNLKWKTLESWRFHTKATLMYKILNDLSAPQLSNSFVKLNDTNINNNNLRNIETDLALQRPILTT